MRTHAQQAVTTGERLQGQAGMECAGGMRSGHATGGRTGKQSL
ncbi:hypothetical protein GWL_39470 [Herbaspirillum sp. GW103]|nr:hypothetical protein GWL_39470 [Herbaspirillum sp. GW103]